MRRLERAAGFTLLELLISMTILAVIVSLTFGAFRLGARAWEKGEEKVEAQQRTRIVLDLLQEQIAALTVRKVANNGKWPFALRGTPNGLEFASYRALRPDPGPGPFRVRYRISGETGKKKLAFSEKSLLLIKQAEKAEAAKAKPDSEPKAPLLIPLEQTEEFMADSFTELLSGVHGLRFDYLKRGQDDEESGEQAGFVWQEQWNPEEGDEGFPLAVRITLQPEAEAAPIAAVARLLEPKATP